MGNTKLYKLLSGSITRYEGTEDKAGVRKVVTYEANGEAAGNLVWLNEKEVVAVGLKKLEEVHGHGSAGQNVGRGVSDSGIAVVAPTHSITGAPAGGPVEGEEEGEAGDGTHADTSDGVVHVDKVMEGTTSAPTSGNPAVERVLAKKAAANK